MHCACMQFRHSVQTAPVCDIEAVKQYQAHPRGEVRTSYLMLRLLFGKRFWLLFQLRYAEPHPPVTSRQ